MTVTSITSVAQWNEISKAARADNKTIIIDFKATWCGPCKAIAPVFEQLSNEYPETEFISIDVDTNPAIAQKYGITAMPTFIIRQGDEIVETIRGANPPALKTSLAKYASKGAKVDA